MKVIEMKLSQLTPYENNVKEHPPEQVEQIKQSILQYGMNDPIAVWGKNNLIVEGHGRYEAMKELGEDTVPVIRLDHLSDEDLERVRREITSSTYKRAQKRMNRDVNNWFGRGMNKK